MNERRLAEALADLLQVDVQQLSLTKTFAEQGIDSLVALRFARKIQDFCDVEIELEWLFDYPTIQQLANFLDQKIKLSKANVV